LVAGQYYDSASFTLDDKYPNFEEIEKRNDKLKDLVINILEIQLQDSLLRMSKDVIFRENSIDKAIELEKQASLLAQTQAKGNQSGISLGAMDSKSSFPFYNPQLRDQGAAEFKRRWGSRPNVDNWRYTSRLKKLLNSQSQQNDKPKDTVEKDDPALVGVAPERKVYMKRIPFKASEKDVAYKKIETSYLLVAQQYQYALDQPANAITYYEEMLKRFPASESKPKIYYELAKLYKKQEDTKGLDKYMALLEKEYPESNFLKILNGRTDEIKPEISEAASGNKEVLTAFSTMYAAFQKEEYKNAIAIKQKTDRNFMGNSMQPKFEYLQAICHIKLGETEIGFSELEQIISDYPNTVTATKSQDVLDAYKRLQNPVVKTESKNNDWEVYDGKEDVFYLLSFAKGTNSNMVRAALSDYCKKDYVLETLEVSKAQTFGSAVFLYISGFSKPKIARDFLNRLKANPTLFSSKGLFEYQQAWVSKTNMIKLAKSNNIKSYMNFADF